MDELVKLLDENLQYVSHEMNDDCDHKIFAERFDFLESKAKKTVRLKEERIEVVLAQSSISASRYLEKNITNIKKSTVCNYIKKRNPHR